jgi:hypothetical protein
LIKGGTKRETEDEISYESFWEKEEEERRKRRKGREKGIGKEVL